MNKKKNTDELNFETFVEKFNEPLYKYLQRLTGNAENAEDILQESLIKIARSLSDLKDSAKVKTWAFRIATNTATDFFRKKSNRDYEEFDEFLHTVETRSDDRRNIEEKVIIEEMNECIRKEMENIAPSYRAVLILYYFERMTIAEIAKICALSTAAVKIRIHRGKEYLERVLTDACDFYYDKNSNVRCYSKIKQ